MMNEVLNDVKWKVDRYHTNKILSGRGLEDDPEWVIKFEEILDKYRDD